MIPEIQLQSVAFPWILYDQDNKLIASGPGSLVQPALPGYSEEVKDHAASAPLGFSRDPFGYACYKVKVPAYVGNHFALYGLKIIGISNRPSEPGVHNERFSRDEIKRYVEKVIEQLNVSMSLVSVMLTASIHDVRTMNREVNEIAEILDDRNLFNQGSQDVQKAARDLKAVSQVLAAAISSFEYTFDPRIVDYPPQRMNLFGKFDKMRHLIDRRFQWQKRVRINGDGSPNVVRAPAILEIVPYILLQNAVKYAPVGTDIVIDVYEDHDEVVANVGNFGPVVKEDEREKVFQFMYRGEAAREMDVGSGIGLFNARRIVRAVGGTLTFHQNATAVFFGAAEYRWTELQLKIPRSEL